MATVSVNGRNYQVSLCLPCSVSEHYMGEYCRTGEPLGIVFQAGACWHVMNREPYADVFDLRVNFLSTAHFRASKFTEAGGIACRAGRQHSTPPPPFPLRQWGGAFFPPFNQPHCLYFHCAAPTEGVGLLSCELKDHTVTVFDCKFFSTGLSLGMAPRQLGLCHIPHPFLVWPLGWGNGVLSSIRAFKLLRMKRVIQKMTPNPPRLLYSSGRLVCCKCGSWVVQAGCHW